MNAVGSCNIYAWWAMHVHIIGCWVSGAGGAVKVERVCVCEWAASGKAERGVGSGPRELKRDNRGARAIAFIVGREVLRRGDARARALRAASI